MKKKIQAAAFVVFALILTGAIVAGQVWRVRQFQKATGFGFIKAMFVLGR